MASQTINGDTLAATYSVGTGAAILVSAVIGNGQLGDSAVWLDGTLVTAGGVNHLNIGSAEQLRGKQLKFRSIASDLNTQTNRTNVTYFLAGGTTDDDYTLAKMAAEDGASVVYEATFQLL
jgi:hypothetical protein